MLSKNDSFKWHWLRRAFPKTLRISLKDEHFILYIKSVSLQYLTHNSDIKVLRSSLEFPIDFSWESRAIEGIWIGDLHKASQYTFLILSSGVCLSPLQPCGPLSDIAFSFARFCEEVQLKPETLERMKPYMAHMAMFHVGCSLLQCCFFVSAQLCFRHTSFKNQFNCLKALTTSISFLLVLVTLRIQGGDSYWFCDFPCSSSSLYPCKKPNWQS